MKYLGVNLDNELTFRKYIISKCQTAILNILRIETIRSFLTLEACKILMTALVLSNLDYANSVLIDLQHCAIRKLQVIQNIAARITLNRSKYCSATQCLKELQWLPVKHRIQYKVLVLVYKRVRGEAPDYLINCLHKYQPNRLGLRSGVHNALDLHIPFCTKKTQAERSFSVAGPRL